jgi:4-hydroxy-tetrahydrodipicolinate synthase
VIRCAVDAVAGRLPVLVGVAESATRTACRLAADAKDLGADGLMVLPGMIYPADTEEAVAHFRQVARASDLPVMIYNNPVAYGIDLPAEGLAALADEPTIVAVKESSDDPRRLTDIVNATGERFTLFCGVDDLALESALLGCTGWVAGLVNAFPHESVRLWRLATEGRWEEARDLYRWFMPLLHLDTDKKLVQYVKFAQALAGYGSETVRLPRRRLEGAERARVAAIVEAALADRPQMAAE